MAALLLSVAGAAAGSALFGQVGAIAGRLVGAIGGSLIDQSLFGGHNARHTQGPRLSDLGVMASTEGAPIARLYGRARLNGEVIWATQLEEVIDTRNEGGGGKGGSGGGSTSTTYSYFANFAVGLCEGRIGHVSRVWADGKPLDMTGIVMRVYRGDEAQTADPLIAAKQGAANAPAYRGLAYVVFERLPLANFGNRIPQLSFEVVRPVGRLEQMVRAVTLIPGTTEFGYEPSGLVQTLGPGRSRPENRHVAHARSDVVAALDELQGVCPNVRSVALVVAWIGTDLRAGHCEIRPGIENLDKSVHDASWSVAGIGREDAHVVSQVAGRPAYGGTPSDTTVVNLIAELKARGLKVTLYPFVMMDVPAGNTLSDPHTGAASQPPYPWRGRITCHPAPGRPGTPDGTATAGAQVDAFFGDGSDWRYRRMVMHYAGLAASAGGVDAFLIGSELRGLTRVRSASGVYPAVNQLVALAADVKAVVGAGTKVGYGADWTEYGAHVVDPMANEVRFPLDALWASPSIDAIGIDYYAPLSDWRDHANHLDRALAHSIYDRGYLRGNLARGEGYDWYYADDTARGVQDRTPITDGLGKPWVFRVKDLWSFWSQPHYERIGGVELGSPTAWTPRSKPIWLTELGCGAVDKGANQPSTFPDPKSSESAVPYFSDGTRDDLMQRRHLESVLGAFDFDFGATSTFNPMSPVYGAPMIDASNVYLWTWDARPYPVFPAALDVWSDGSNWETGHWLTGRLGGAPLDGLITQLLEDSGIGGCDATGLGEGPDGYVVDRPMAPRSAIEPLSKAYAFDASEQVGVLTFRSRGGEPVAELDEDDLVLRPDAPPFRLIRAQETELPREISFGYSDGSAEHRRATASSRRLVVGSSRVAFADLAVVTHGSAAERRAEISLQDAWASRESADFALGPRQLAFTPGDVVALTIDGRRRLLELREITDTAHRAVNARSIDPEVFELPLAPPRRRIVTLPPAAGPVQAVTLDLPAFGSDSPTVLRIAVCADPWPGPVAVWRSGDGLAFQRAALMVAPSIVGQTLDALPAGSTRGIDRFGKFRVRLIHGSLSSVSDNVLSGGANAAALQRADGAWEVLQFAHAELVGERTYELSRLVRGRGGSEWAMGNPLDAGATFVLLGAHVVPLASGLSELGRLMQLRVVAAGRDHGDATASALSVRPSAVALRPLSPVHLRARRSVAGVTFDWVRRTRAAAGSWVIRTVPLGEESEAYELDILSGSIVLRTLKSATSSALYPAAAELADFGSPQASLSIRVAQLSAAVGRGVAATATLQP